MKHRAAIITGVGLATPLGRNVEGSWANLKNLQTGIRHVPRSGVPNCFQYMGKVEEFALRAAIPPNLQAQAKFLNRSAQLGFNAAFEAVSQAAVRFEDIPVERRALFIASGDATKVGYDSFYPAFEEGADDGWRSVDPAKLNRATLTKVNPFFVLESISNNLFSFLSAFYELRGPNTSLGSQSPYGSQALELAYRTIRQGRADIALVVGYGNWITDVPLYELEGLGLLSKCHSGASSFKPFDRGRDGFIPGEGGAAIFLEAEDLVQSRAVKALGRVCGCGNCIDLEDGRGLEIAPKVTGRSMRMALEEAGCELDALAFICGHGSATQKGDRAELRSILELIEAGNVSLPICAMKPYSGHMGAASDLAEIVWGIKSVAQHLVPGTLNFREADEEFARLRVSSCHLPTSKAFFVSSSYGMGSQSSSIVIGV